MEKAEIAAVHEKKFVPTTEAAQGCKAAQAKEKADSSAEDSAAKSTVAKTSATIAAGHRETLKPRTGELKSAYQSWCVLMPYFALMLDGHEGGKGW